MPQNAASPQASSGTLEGAEGAPAHYSAARAAAVVAAGQRARAQLLLFYDSTRE